MERRYTHRWIYSRTVINRDNCFDDIRVFNSYKELSLCYQDNEEITREMLNELGDEIDARIKPKPHQKHPIQIASFVDEENDVLIKITAHSILIELDEEYDNFVKERKTE